MLNTWLALYLSVGIVLAFGWLILSLTPDAADDPVRRERWPLVAVGFVGIAAAWPLIIVVYAFLALRHWLDRVAG